LLVKQPTPETPTEEPALEEERVTEESLSRAFWPLWVLPFAGVGLAFLFAAYFPDDVNSFYMDTVFPFGITFSLGTFFSYGWEVQRLWIQELPRRWAPWVIGGALVFVLFVLGGPSTIIDDPWLAGMVVFPGIRMLAAYQKRRPTRRP
jgi:hypothetical protein